MGFLARLANLFGRKKADALADLAKNVRNSPRAPSLGGLVFRVRFTLPDTLAIQSNEYCVELTPPDTTHRLLLCASGGKTELKDARQIVLKGGPFTSQEEAREAGGRARRAFILCLAQMGIGFSLGSNEGGSVLTDHGRQYFENLIGERILDDLAEVMIFDDRIPTRFINTELSLVKGSPTDHLRRFLPSALRIAREFTDREQVAIELYGASFFERSVRARFVTLMIAVEALLEPRNRSAGAGELVEGFVLKTRETQGLSKDEKDSLCGALKWLKKESINKTGRELANNRLGGRQYSGRSPASFFKFCYDVRSEIVHTGAVRTEGVDLVSLSAELEKFVADLILQPFGELRDIRE